MNKKILASAIIVIVFLSVSGLLVYNQFSSLQTRISELEAQISELRDQNTTAQEQIRELELENREKQDRLEDFTHEIAKTRHLNVEITSFWWEGGFHPIVGVTLTHPVNVTVQNNDDIPVFGLTLNFVLFHKDSGTQIGSPGFSAKIGRVNAGASVEAVGSVFTTVGTSLDDAVCVVTLSSGSIVLDEWTQAIGTVN